jgi:hypothetical protein
MRLSKNISQTVIASAFSIGMLLAASGSASAYVTCNSNGDCWHTDEQLKIPNVTLSFHDDAWREQHQADKQYTWHDPDSDHDWQHGYWDHGEWHTR